MKARLYKFIFNLWIKFKTSWLKAHETQQHIEEEKRRIYLKYGNGSALRPERSEDQF